MSKRESLIDEEHVNAQVFLPGDLAGPEVEHVVYDGQVRALHLGRHVADNHLLQYKIVECSRRIWSG